LTSEQLEASRAERMRHNGNGTLTLEDARTWIEETGLCLFLPRRQFSSSIAPSFVEAVAGQRDATPDPPKIAAAEELLVRLELDGVAVRLNLLGLPGEQPDYVVAGWVLPYVYALRGDRDWRRTPQLTGSRQVSPLAVQAYKLLEAGDATISNLTHTLGREVTEVAVLRAITELWQQLRIIPVIQAPGKAAEWQLLRQRFQKAIAEGASTSQVTAISVLASIYLQAVIAASMEDVEVFLSALTARSKVREVLRGLVATRQVHTLSLGHAPHFYVAGTLPEFAVATSIYANANLPSSAYYLKNLDDYEEDMEASLAGVREPVKTEEAPAPAVEVLDTVIAVAEVSTEETPEETPKVHAPGRPASGKPLVDRSDRNRPESKAVEHKLAPAASQRPAPPLRSRTRHVVQPRIPAGLPTEHAVRRAAVQPPAPARQRVRLLVPVPHPGLARLLALGPLLDHAPRQDHVLLRVPVRPLDHVPRVARVPRRDFVPQAVRVPLLVPPARRQAAARPPVRVLPAISPSPTLLPGSSAARRQASRLETPARRVAPARSARILPLTPPAASRPPRAVPVRLVSRGSLPTPGPAAREQRSADEHRGQRLD